MSPFMLAQVNSCIGAASTCLLARVVISMAPVPALVVEAPLRDVLEAVGTFLAGCGLTRSGALLRQEAPLIDPTTEALIVSTAST